ncbi:MAG: transpeptidase family protein [Chitinophagales bacterium]|nr:transpeptidase family protein [Chitinophagales bacterium]
MSNKKEIYWRIGLAYLMLIIFSLAILWKVFYLQNVQGAYYRSLADSITTKYATIDAERGNIYSHDGRLLATSLPRFEIRIDFKADGLKKDSFRVHVDSLSIRLANFFKDKNSNDYKRMLVSARQRGERYFLLKKNISYTQLLALKTFPILRDGQFKGGLIVVQDNRREYPFKLLAKRTIGYVRDNNVQPIGLETKFNNDLTGNPGKRLMQKVSGGEFIPLNDKNEIEPENGKDIITTIDINLQDVAEDALMKALIANKADHGCCVVMDVKTGAIRAMANLGKETNGAYTEKYNYAVGESHEPGSTFKLASMLALLEDGYISLDDTVDLEMGVHQYWTQTMRDAERNPYRRVNVVSAFAHSSNVGISMLINNHYYNNPEKYLQHLRRLGLDKKLGIEVPGEQDPYIKSTSDKTFTRYSLPWMSVGYEVRVSPLQILSLYNAVANGGKEMKPYLVQSIDEYGKPIRQYEPEVRIQKICSEKTLHALKILLKAVADSGTAKGLKSPNYTFAGKTGTAQIANEKNGYANKIYQSSFVGYFPAEYPLYSCIVVVNNPSNGDYYGAKVAGPVFKEIADKVFASEIDIHPSLATLKDDTAAMPQIKAGYKADVNAVLNKLNVKEKGSQDAAWLSVATGKNDMMLAAKATEAEAGIVPDVKGMGLRNALYLLENSGLKVNVVGAGSVASQSIAAGTRVNKGESISINLTMN